MSQEESQVDISGDIKRFLVLMFNEFCGEQGIGVYQRVNVSPVTFIRWLEPRLAALGDGPLLVDGAAVYITDKAVEYVRTMPHRYNGLMGLLAFWPYLVLEYRETAHPIRALSVGVVIHYEDGTVANLNRFIRAGVLCDENISEASVSSAIYVQAQALAEIVQAAGTDKVHDNHANERGWAEGPVINALHEAVEAYTCKDILKQQLRWLIGMLPGFFVGAVATAALRRICHLPADPAMDERLAARSRAALNDKPHE